MTRNTPVGLDGQAESLHGSLLMVIEPEKRFHGGMIKKFPVMAWDKVLWRGEHHGGGCGGEMGEYTLGVMLMLSPSPVCEVRNKCETTSTAGHTRVARDHLCSLDERSMNPLSLLVHHRLWAAHVRMPEEGS